MEGRFFKEISQGDAEFEQESFLTNVEEQFQSTEIVHEVRWRLNALREISKNPELAELSHALQNHLTRIFSEGDEENTILANLRELTEIKNADGEMVELRRFVVGTGRTLNALDYRVNLARKIENTNIQVGNLGAFFPDFNRQLDALTASLDALLEKIGDAKVPATAVRKAEETLRDSEDFKSYEELKTRFLREWLTRFTDLSADEVANMDPAEVQRLIVEHSRHQLTQLIRAKVQVSDLDMTQHLGLHDTLEGTFSTQSFWERSTAPARRGFRLWVLSAIQVFGMVRGKRYVLLQSDADTSIYLLFGMGVAETKEGSETPYELVPYVKPFTKKSGYLLEIRSRDIGDSHEYNRELRHYVLPFLFAFDSIKNFNISEELLTFFKTDY